MRSIKMNRVMGVAMLVIVISGCAANSTGVLAVPPLPERIFQQPFRNYYAHGEVGVFPFGSPIYAPGVGAMAADAVSRQLMANGVFRKITAFSEYPFLSFDRQMMIAGEKGVDLMLCGNVLCYMDGGLTPSRVDIEVSVFEVSTGALIWSAVAAEVGSPTAEKDFFMFQTSGKPAPAATTLMMANIDKMVCLFQSESPAYRNLTEDMKLVERGYRHLTKGEYRQARAYFEEAIRMAPDNAHALYNLGVVEEIEGNIAPAISLYEKVIALSPQFIVSQIVMDGATGLSVTALAQQHLDTVKEQTIK